MSPLKSALRAIDEKLFYVCQYNPFQNIFWFEEQANLTEQANLHHPTVKKGLTD